MPFDVFTERRGVLRAGQAVGVVDVIGAQITVLPKATGGRPPAEFMTDLLWASGVAPRLFPLASRVASVQQPLPDALARALADDMLGRLRQAVPRRYHERQEVGSVLRGRIDLTAQARAAPGREQLLAVRYTPLQADNPLTRLIRATARDVLRFARSPGTRQRLAQVDRLLEAAAPRTLDEKLAAGIALSHPERQWAPTVELARQLVKGRSPSAVTAGRTAGMALLFELDDLFEALIRRHLSDALVGTSLTRTHAPLRPKLLRREPSGQHFLRLKPDYVLGDVTGARAVADAKWKLLSPAAPAHGLKSADAYQLATYMARHGVHRGILFFPRADWMPGRWRVRASMLGEAANEVRLVAVDVAGLIDRDPRKAREARRVLGRMTAAAALSYYV
jgi:5-methylcytosine-specific restriction enzyme subunit McrC